MQGNAVADESRCELTNAEVQVAAVFIAAEHVGRAVFRQEGRVSLDEGVVRAREVGGSTPQFGHCRTERLQDLTRGCAGGDALVVGVESRQGVCKTFGEFASLQTVKQFGGFRIGRAPLLEALVPFPLCFAAALSCLSGVVEDRWGDRELLFGVEAQHLLSLGDFVIAQCCAVRSARVLGVRGGPGDDGRQADERRTVVFLGSFHGEVEGVEVFDVGAVFLDPGDVLSVPAVCGVARFDVFCERNRGVVFNRDAVVIPDDDEVAQALCAGKRRCFAGHAFLQVSVTGDDEDVVVENAFALRSRRIEQAAFPARCHCHANSTCNTRAQRAGGDFDTSSVPHLGVAGSERTPLAQLLDVVQFQPVAGEEQLNVLREAGVSGRQNETVAAHPVRVGGAVGHRVLVQVVRGRGEAHRRARVAVAGGLNGISGEKSSGVDSSLIFGRPVQRAHA